MFYKIKKNLKIQLIIMNNFEIIDKLGDGAYSIVYKVKRKQDNNIYALKKVKLTGLSEKEKQNALNEVRILASVKSNFVISYKEAFIDEEDSSLCLVMEYADKGDLYQKISQFKKIGCLIEEIDIWRIFIQMTKGLKALHDLKILHRDLKSANIFLFSDGSAKIGDLNVSKVVYKGLGYTQTGTPYYASPEVWKDQPYDSKSDIWSLGCVTFEIMALRPPFRAENMEKLYKKVILGQYGKLSERYSDDIKEIIKLMLKVNPKDRPSCGQILNHELVKKRIEFFQAQACFDEENWEGNDEGVLLKTIRIPKNILFLTERLPGANYDSEKRIIKKDKDINSNKKMTFPSNSLPDIKFQFNKNKNHINDDKVNSKLTINNKNNINNLGGKTENNSLEKNLNNKKIQKKLDAKNNFELKNNDMDRDEKKVNNLNIIPISNNIKANNNLLLMNNQINQIGIKRNKTNSKKNLLRIENDKRQIIKNHKKDKTNEHNTKKLFKNETFETLNQNKKIGLNSCENKEFEPNSLRNKNKRNPNYLKDDFQKYLKSIGLGDMYKLCMPNSIENNSIQNFNNRYKPGNKLGNYLPNIFSMNNNKNEKDEILGENKVIPNRRLVPLGKKIILFHNN